MVVQIHSGQQMQVLLQGGEPPCQGGFGGFDSRHLLNFSCKFRGGRGTASLDLWGPRDS